MEVNVNTTLDMRSVESILDAHGLDAGGKIQQFVTRKLIKMFEPYVPLDTGVLKNSAARTLAAPYETIVYDTPYAARLYYNPQYNFKGAPQRGAYWAERAWADGKDAFLAELQAQIEGGKL